MVQFLGAVALNVPYTKVTGNRCAIQVFPGWEAKVICEKYTPTLLGGSAQDVYM